MTFVTKLRFESGDRTALEEEVNDLKRLLERKGVECKGPHASPPERIRVPQYRTLAPGDEFSPWDYTVYARELEIHGSDEVARRVGHMEFPERLRVEITVEQKSPVGGS